MFKPFLGVIFLASVLSVAFYPIYQKILYAFGGKEKLSSITTVSIIVICIVVPIIILSGNLIKEAIELYNSMAMGEGASKIISDANIFVDKIENSFAGTGINTNFDLEVYFRNLLSWIIGHFDSIFATILDGFFKFVLMLLTIYYLLLNGEKIKRNLVTWSPLPDSYDEQILSVLRLSVDSVLRGRLLISIAQGFFMGLGFLVFGIGSPVLWGFVTAIISLVPILGTAIVTAPAAAYLFLSGNVGGAIGMLVWGSVCVGLIDNVFYLFLFNKKVNMHPMIMLFAIVGGVEIFGAIGFLVGPIVVSTFLSLMKIFPYIMYNFNGEETS